MERSNTTDDRVAGDTLDTAAEMQRQAGDRGNAIHVVDVPDGDAGASMVATPADFHGTPWQPRSAAPRLGEHTGEVLAELSGRSA
jgi:crotonobetainyl-CoA:carnitine CoA-transferase CaiB-like acyl-CoA transferase